MSDEGPKFEIRTPQFHRSKGTPAPHPPPDPFERIVDLDVNELKSLGCQVWDEPKDAKVLMLFPGEWYMAIPEGFAVECISGRTEQFYRGVTDDDIRFGCLAYGVRVKATR